MLVLGGLSCQMVLVLLLGCSPAPAIALGAKTPGGEWVSATCDVTLWFCCTFQNSSVPSMAVPLPEDGRYKGAQVGAGGWSMLGQRGQILSDLGVNTASPGGMGAPGCPEGPDMT